jgi:hypothetical protein
MAMGAVVLNGPRLSKRQKNASGARVIDGKDFRSTR